MNQLIYILFLSFFFFQVSFSFISPFYNIQKLIPLKAKQGYVVIKEEGETVEEIERRLNQFIDETGDLEIMQRQKRFESNLLKRRRKTQNRIYFDAVDRREKREYLEEYGYWRPYPYEI